jgi:hypothetical protein
MAGDPEARTQIARLLRDERLRNAAPGELAAAVDSGIEMLAEGIVAEASASDDVSDRESAIAFIDARLAFLESLVSNEQKQRIRKAIEDRLKSW